MDNLLGGNADGGLNLGNNPLEQWFFEMPPCTRYWTVATVVTSILLQCKVISPLQLFYTFRAVYFKSQVRIPHCLHQTLSGLSAPAKFSRRRWLRICSTLTRGAVVPPAPNHVHLLRTTFLRSPVPPLLHDPLLPPPRILLISPSILLPPPLRDRLPPAPDIPDPDLHLGLPGTLTLPDARVYLVAAQPGHPPGLPGHPRLQRPVPAVGTHGLQPVHAWQHPPRRDPGRHGRACLVLLQ